MANEKNLKPIQSENEAREKGRKGGINSGESRRRKRTIRDTMEILLSTPLSAEEAAELEKYGLDCEEFDRRAALAVGLYKKAVEGDCKAFSLIADIIDEHKQTQTEKDSNESANNLINSLLSRIEG